MINTFFDFDYISYGDFGVKDFAFQQKSSGLLSLSIINDQNYIDYINLNVWKK